MSDLHPLDIDALQSGDVISVAQIESITQTHHGTDRYHFAARKLAAKIEMDRLEMGRPVVVRQKKGALEICDAHEQLKFAKRRSAETARKLRRTLVVLATTRVGDLTLEEIADHERLSITTAARMIAFSHRAPKRIVAAASDDLADAKRAIIGKR